MWLKNFKVTAQNQSVIYFETERAQIKIYQKLRR